jgi:hypothetical protein
MHAPECAGEHSDLGVGATHPTGSLRGALQVHGFNATKVYAGTVPFAVVRLQLNETENFASRARTTRVAFRMDSSSSHVNNATTLTTERPKRLNQSRIPAVSPCQPRLLVVTSARL